MSWMSTNHCCSHQANIEYLNTIKTPIYTLAFNFIHTSTTYRYGCSATTLRIQNCGLLTVLLSACPSLNTRFHPPAPQPTHIHPSPNFATHPEIPVPWMMVGTCESAGFSAPVAGGGYTP